MQAIYLAGSINGMSDEACNDWRRRVAAALGSRYAILDPMRRDYRGNEAGNAATIVLGDLQDIDAASVVVVNASRASWGTAMETWYARSAGKRIIVFGAGDKPSPWLVYCASEMCATLEDAIHALSR